MKGSVIVCLSKKTIQLFLDDNYGSVLKEMD